MVRNGRGILHSTKAYRYAGISLETHTIPCTYRYHFITPIIYGQILINAKRKTTNWKEKSKTELTGRIPLRSRRYALDCSAKKEEEEGEICKVPHYVISYNLLLLFLLLGLYPRN
jgi:hypothetical protein